MSEAAILSRTFPFEHKLGGTDEPRKWELPRPTVATHRAYGRHLERLIVQGINRHRDVLDDMAYDRAMDKWTAGFITGRYNWKSRAKGGFWDTLDDPENQKELLWFWFTQADQSLTRKQFEAMFDARKEDLEALLYEMLTEKNPTQAPAQSGAESR